MRREHVDANAALDAKIFTPQVQQHENQLICRLQNIDT